MLSKNFFKTLEFISEKLNEQNIKWMIVGSTNLSLQGIKILPKDIDIVVDFKNLIKVQKIFSNFLISKIEKMDSKVNIPWWRITLIINKIPTEIFSEKKDGIYIKRLNSNKIKNIYLENILMPCLELTSEMETYKETGRENKIELIKNFLKIE